MPPLGASSSAEGDGDKKKAAGLGILWVAYNSLLESQPILAKSLTSMTGFGLGDLLAQKFLEKKVNFGLFLWDTCDEPDVAGAPPCLLDICTGAVTTTGGHNCLDVSVKCMRGAAAVRCTGTYLV